jgi:steroid 5-alpha reductase family enzyme
VSLAIDSRSADARRLLAALPRDLPMLAIAAAAVAAPPTRDFALVNLAVQAVLFVFGALIPAARTQVMAHVDVVWPWGLVAIGGLALAYGDTGSGLLRVVAGIYLVAGLRMGLWALRVLLTDYPHDDLPRYRYRRLEWQREGYRSPRLPMLHEMAQQGLCNASVLAAPALVAVASPGAGADAAVIAGVALWAGAWALESLADFQKGRFARRDPQADTRVCEVGLWRYSRHPNYFFQWVQWHGLIVACLPALIRLHGHLALAPWCGLAFGLVAISPAMLYVLVFYTGAVPAEHFSARHRPGYADYQRRVNRFVPGPRR